MAGLGLSLQLEPVMFVAFGVVFGLVFGAIPGLNATIAMVLLLPVSYNLDPVSAFALLIGGYLGGITGGLFAAVKLGIPGTAASVVTVFDGHPLAKAGRGGYALGLASVSSFYGGLLSWVALVLFTPQLAALALKIGPFEYATIIAFSLIFITLMTSRELAKSFLMVVLGLLIPTVGLDPVGGVERFTFELAPLRNGLGLIAVLTGIFVVSSLLKESETLSELHISPPARVKQAFRQLWTVWRYWRTLLRSAAIGVGIGVLPGIGAAVAPFVSYEQAKRRSKTPELFGKGAPEGVVASETTNNATVGGALIPGLALGIPGDVPVVILLSGLMLHGFQPGPLFFSQNLDMVYSTYVSFLVALVLMIVFLLAVGIRLLDRALSVPKVYLIPSISVVGFLGVYNLRNSLDDVGVALVAGLGAYVALKARYPLTPLIIAMILGPMLEENLRLALNVSQGSWVPFLTEPVAAVFVALTLGSVALITWRRLRSRPSTD
jgi:putative tricarboxylic transport membrane protein